MVMIFVGEVVLVLDGIPGLFLPYKNLCTEQEFFVSTQTKIVVKLLTRLLNIIHINIYLIKF
jgi:hypothetical protein